MADYISLFGILLTILGMASACASWLIGKWSEQGKELEKVRVDSYQQALNGLKSSVSEHSHKLDVLTLKLNEAEKSLLITNGHLQAQNTNSDQLGNILSGLVKLLSTKTDLLHVEHIGEGNFRMSGKTPPKK